MRQTHRHTYRHTENVIHRGAPLLKSILRSQIWYKAKTKVVNIGRLQYTCTRLRCLETTDGTCNITTRPIGTIDLS